MFSRKTVNRKIKRYLLVKHPQFRTFYLLVDFAVKMCQENQSIQAN